MNTISQQDVFIWVVGILLIFFIGRELVCWYWKINARLATQKDTTETLKQVLNEMKFITDYIKKKDSSAQEIQSTPTEQK